MSRWLILGHGFMAHALAKECHARKVEVCDNKIPASRLTFDAIQALIYLHRPHLVVNAAAFIPSPSVDACKDDPEQNIRGNVLLPAAIAHACRESDVPLMHLSTGCIFDEQREYTEEDTPTRGWDGYCGAYVGAKLLAEKVVLEHPESYVLRLRLPFDEVDSPRNFITKMLAFDDVYDNFNALTHRGDFAKAAVDLWQIQAPFGIYNMTNNGGIYSRMLIQKMRESGLPVKEQNFVHKEGVTGCKLSINKLLKTGVIMRPVEEAVREAIQNWRKA